MSHKTEKEEAIELKVPTPLCSETCKIPSLPACNASIEAGSTSSFTDRPAPLHTPLPEKKKTLSVNRCLCCTKRVGLTGFRCRCGHMFCSLHRYSDRHDCSFDYKAAAREVIARENPVVRAAKILKV